MIRPGEDAESPRDDPQGEHVAQHLEMTITRDAFVRNLPAAVEHVPFETHGDEFVHEGATQRWRIRLTALPPRAIGSLALERHSVEIRLRGYDADAQRRFLRRFHDYFRRGGG